MMFYQHKMIAGLGVAGVIVVGAVLILRQWRKQRFHALLDGEERITEWIDEDDRRVCIGEHAVFANTRFICWRGHPADLKRAEYNPRTGIFKFVIHCPAAGVLPWRVKHSLKITVPPEAVAAAREAEHFFEPWAKNHRRHSVDPPPPVAENA